MDYIWQKLRGEMVLRTPYYGVMRDRLLHPQGHEVDYYVIDHAREAVGVVATNDAGRVLMVQQWRHPVQQLVWSLPAGGMESGESPEQAIHRELREETGYEAARVRPLYRYHPNPGTANQVFHLFTADGLKDVGATLPGEIHKAGWFLRSEIEAMLASNEMLDGLTLVAILMWLRSTVVAD